MNIVYDGSSEHDYYTEPTFCDNNSYNDNKNTFFSFINCVCVPFFVRWLNKSKTSDCVYYSEGESNERRELRRRTIFTIQSSGSYRVYSLAHWRVLCSGASATTTTTAAVTAAALLSFISVLWMSEWMKAFQFYYYYCYTILYYYLVEELVAEHYWAVQCEKESGRSELVFCLCWSRVDIFTMLIHSLMICVIFDIYPSLSLQLLMFALNAAEIAAGRFATL